MWSEGCTVLHSILRSFILFISKSFPFSFWQTNLAETWQLQFPQGWGKFLTQSPLVRFLSALKIFHLCYLHGCLPRLDNVADSPTPLHWFWNNPLNFPLTRGKEPIPSPCIPQHISLIALGVTSLGQHGSPLLPWISRARAFYTWSGIIT